MDELNPYESPKTPAATTRPLATLKRAFGFSTLVVLTPISVFIAGFVSCLAVFPAIAGLGQNYQKAFIVGLTVFLVPPVVVLVLMGSWAIFAYKREAAERGAKRKEPPGSGL